jgi:hypothetical protein
MAAETPEVPSGGFLPRYLGSFYHNLNPRVDKTRNLSEPTH